MAEEAQFLMRKGKVINVQDTRMVGKNTKYEKQVGGLLLRPHGSIRRRSIMTT